MSLSSVCTAVYAALTILVAVTAFVEAHRGRINPLAAVGVSLASALLWPAALAWALCDDLADGARP